MKLVKSAGRYAVISIIYLKTRKLVVDGPTSLDASSWKSLICFAIARVVKLVIVTMSNIFVYSLNSLERVQVKLLYGILGDLKSQC